MKTIFNLLLFPLLYLLQIPILKNFYSGLKFGHWKKFNTILILSTLLFPTYLFSADACAPSDETSIMSLTNTSDTYTVSIAKNDSISYYIQASTAGTLTITTNNTNNKIHLNGSESICPAATVSGSTSLTYSDTTAFDINVVVFASNAETHTLTIVFTPDTSNTDPTFTSTPITTATESINYSYTVATDDTDGDTVTVAGTTIPAWLSFDGTTLSGIPTASDVGPHSVILTANDGNGGTATQSFTITVAASGINTPPTFTSTPITTALEGIEYYYTVTTEDVNNDTVIVTATTLPSWLAFDGYNLIGEPNATDVGDHNVTLTADDGTDTTDQNFTITVEAVAPDLSISKVDSAAGGPVDVSTGFYYTITVNNKGSATATGVSVTDTLPPGLDINLTTSNASSSDWNCTRSVDVITCSLLAEDGNLSITTNRTITLHATAPSTAGTITNTASVTLNESDYDSSNNVATETTKIVSTGYQEIDEANELCYRDTTNLTDPTDCIKVGNFYYGEGCDATILIKSDENLNTNLSDVNVTVMIAVSNNKDLDGGSCTSTAGNCDGPVPFAPEFSPSYLEAYIVPDVGTMASDSNFTIGHSDTHNKKPLYQIAVYATYNYDGVYHYGRVYNCDGVSEGGITAIASADVIDTYINGGNAATYNASGDTSNNGLKYIQTMVASDTRSITAVHLDADTKEAIPYIEPAGYNGSLPFYVVPQLVATDSSGRCLAPPETIYAADGTTPLRIPVTTGNYSGSSIMTVADVVRKDARLQLIIVDPRLLSADGQDCLATSSTSGNLEGVGQCANSEGQYIAGFSVDAWDRCAINNGAPCLSKNGGYSGGSDPTYPGYNPIYDNEFGCYMCTFDIQPACSSDNFAIRPEKFDMLMSDTNAPNLLRAGEGYKISLTAKDALNIIPVDYTVIDHNFIDDLNTSTIRYFKNGAVDTDGLLHGSSDLNKSATAYMLAGLSSLTKTQPANAEEIVQVTYDDVGLVGLEVYDENWAAVDNDDTPMDCNSSEHTYICGDLNVTFIPHHFNVENIHLRNHKDGNFTYLSNDLNMSMHIDVNLSARNAYDGITQNFQQGSLYYENPLSVDINVTEWNASIPVTTRHPLGNDTHKHDIPTETSLGFGGSDANGTHLIPWNESNATQQLMFNYTRKNNQTVNPFILNGTDVNITVQSTYTDLTGLTPSSPAVIDGSGIADRNATLYFARVKSSQFFYDDVINSVQTPISVLVYCDAYPTCSELTNEVKTNEPYWWLSVEHDEAMGDGNITLISPPTVITGAGNPTITPDTDVTVIPAQPGVDTDVYVNSGATTSLPMTVEIFLDTTPSTDTNSWLIYNTASDIANPDPFYKVRFIGGTGWAGHGDTGHVVDSNTSIKKNRRLGW